MAVLSSDQLLADQSSVPNTVTIDNTRGGSTMTDDYVIQLVAAVAASLVQKLNLTSSPLLGDNQGGGGAPTTQIKMVYKWTQWLFWCFGCGVNLHHHTGQCPPQKRKTNHTNRLSATKTDPQGGNSKKDHLW